MYHADTAVNGLTRAGKLDLFALEEHLAFVLVIEAIDNIHQRTFTRAVFTQ